MKNNKWQVTQNVASHLIVVFSGILFYLGLSNFAQVKAVAGQIFSLLSPFFIGIAIAYLLDGPARYFQKKLFRGKRGPAVALSFVCALVLVGVLLGLVIPQVVQSLTTLAAGVPGYLTQLRVWIQDVSLEFGLDSAELDKVLSSYGEMISQASSLITTLVLPKLLGYGVAIGNGLVTAVTAIISALYMLLEKDKLIHQMHKVVYAALPPRRGRKVLETCSHANEVFSGFINGKLLDSLIIGIICFIGMSLFRMPLAVLISTVIGVTNVIPFFGPFIGAIPSIMILLIFDPIKALEFAIFVLVLQQFDGNILGPKILGDSTGLSALWVLVAIIVGGGLFGFPGMVLGVPTFAVLYSLVSDWLALALKRRGVDEYGHPLPPEECLPPEVEETAPPTE